MSRVGKVKYNLRKLQDIQKKMNKFNEVEIDLFIQSCAKEIAARFLAKVIKRTPVGDYNKYDGEGNIVRKSTKKGGTLRRGWTAEKNQSASKYVESLKVNQFGGVYVIEIVNPVEYCTYVEFGHRTRNHKGWVRGRFMLTISEQELQTDAPKILERKLARKLGECFK